MQEAECLHLKGEFISFEPDPDLLFQLFFKNKKPTKNKKTWCVGKI